MATGLLLLLLLYATPAVGGTSIKRQGESNGLEDQKENEKLKNKHKTKENPREKQK
jgi:hypothetical protein